MTELEVVAAFFLCITNFIQLIEVREMRKSGKAELRKIAKMILDYVDTIK